MQISREISGRSRCITWLCLCVCVLLLSGCYKNRVAGGGGAAPSGQSTGTGARGTKPYTIRGKTYYPLVTAHGFSEEGVASWYGPDFHGKQTANGERYDMYSMTAAHKLLPFGTQLRVTNLRNNRSIIVRVNDRGPFVADRIIDLSKSGAQQLDILGAGTARVRLESIGAVPGLKNGDISGKFYVQVGAFAKEGNAVALARRLQGQGVGARVVFARDVNFWRVQAGPYPSLVQAEKAFESRLRDEFGKGFIVAE